MNTTTPTPTPPSASLTDAPRADAPLAELLPVQPGLGLEAEQSFLQFVMERYDGFFDSVHNKANFWLAFNTFALGGIIAGYKDFVVALCAGLGQRLLDGEMLLFVALNLRQYPVHFSGFHAVFEAQGQSRTSFGGLLCRCRGKPACRLAREPE